MSGGEQLVALGRIDAVVVRMCNRWGSDAEVYFLGTGIAHHLHNLPRGRPAHDRVVYEHDPFAFDDRAIGGMFQANPLIADRLRWLNEGPANVVVADNAELVGNAGLPR